MLLPQLLFVLQANASVASDTNIKSGTGVKHPLVLTPSAGYGELPFLEGPMTDAIYYNNEHSTRGSGLFSCSADYLLFRNWNVEGGISYQPAPFSSMNMEQYYYYQYASNPYSFKLLPAFEFGIDYYKSDSMSIGVVAGSQTMTCSSPNGQPFYPSSVVFREYSLGIRGVYYFGGRYNKNLQYYAGGRIDVCVWSETDNWANGANSQYIPVIVSSADGLILPNNSQFSMTLLGGIRYFFTAHVGAQAEAGFGFGSPYYTQAGLVFLLNNGNLKDAVHN